MNYNFIAIEGNIGAGKTTLASRLASFYNARLILEEFEQNPFLPKFYKEPEKYALALEMSFLAERFHQMNDEFKKGGQLRVADYFFDKTLIFAQANLNKDELGVFRKFYSIIRDIIPRPDLLIFLNPLADKLKDNITKRGRSYEQDIQVDYLYRIQKAYLKYLEAQTEVPVLMLDLQSTRYVSSLDDFSFLDRLLLADYKKGLTRVAL